MLPPTVGKVRKLSPGEEKKSPCCIVRDILKGKLGEKFLSAQSFYLTLTKRSFNRQF